MQAINVQTLQGLSAIMGAHTALILLARWLARKRLCPQHLWELQISSRSAALFHRMVQGLNFIKNRIQVNLYRRFIVALIR